VPRPLATTTSNLQIGNGMDSFGTEFRYRNPESGKLDGGLIPVDFAMSAAAYGCKGCQQRRR
jgi:3D-(3,5/4)-trihydroxycyclohexane-1,2-dione acylhydrolase (decyclizing)